MIKLSEFVSDAKRSLEGNMGYRKLSRTEISQTNRMTVNGEVIKLITGTPEQEAIWKAMRESSLDLMVVAYAGTGKTTTGVQGLVRMGPKVAGHTAFVAFNRPIARELRQKVPCWVEACTFHSLMYGVVNRHTEMAAVVEDKTMAHLEQLVGTSEFYRLDPVLKHGVEKLVSLVKNTLSDTSEESLKGLCKHFGILFDDGTYSKAFLLVEELVVSAREDLNAIDYDDMLWVPVVEGWKLPKFDTLCVDEAQDLNVCQQEAIARMANRVILVGDQFQAIYGFRGADTHSMDRMQKRLWKEKREVLKLPLSMTRRCPKSHVALAKKVVKDFSALPDAPEGRIETVGEDQAVEQMKPGDLVLCRVNAPVVSFAFRLLARRVPANIQGRDIGKGLRAIIRKLVRKSGKGTVELLLSKLAAYQNKELAKMKAMRSPPKNQMAMLNDKCTCIRLFCGGKDDVEDVHREIDEMFTEEGQKKEVVLLSTTHRAKGLEADRVWVIYPELMPHPSAKEPWEKEQEDHIWYVTMTRSKDSLFLIPKPKEEDPRSSLLLGI